MANEPIANPTTDHPPPAGAVELPRPTVAPLVVALGVTVLAAGVAFGVPFVLVGALLLATGIGLWVAHLLPGRGHMHEPLVAPELRPTPIHPRLGQVEVMQAGAPGYRLRLPEKVHPISAGIKGGIVGGLLMPIPALVYGIVSGHGIWYTVNLLAGIVLPGVGEMSVAQLEQFHLSLLIASVLIHIVVSLIVGMIYGVLLPTLPNIPKPVAWGGLLMPILWTTVTYFTMGFFNPLLSLRVDWPWFIFSQFIFGVVAAVVVYANERRHPLVAGAIGGICGGLVMPLPAMIWAISTGRAIWYPANLLAAIAHPEMYRMTQAELQQFRPDWFFTALGIHLAISLAFGLVYGALLPRVKTIPAPLAWGGLVLPLIWTGLSYSQMGIVNPVLQERVDWPWFIVSQFVFGLAAAIVVVRSEMVHIPPAGAGPEADREAATEWLTE